MVFLAHLVDGFFHSFYPGSALLQAVAPPVTRGLVFGVEIFFLISGYVIAGSCLKYDFREFAARRFLRLYPVFLFFTLLFAAANYVLVQEPHKRDIGVLLANITFLDFWLATPKLTPNAWSISCEVWYYVFAYVGISIFMKGLLSQRVEAYALYAVAVLLLIFFAPITVYFVVGVVVFFALRARKDVSEAIASPTVQYGLLAVLGVLAASFTRASPIYIPENLLQVVPVGMLLAATLLFVQVAKGTSILDGLLRNPVMGYLGTISYSLYLAHPYTYFIAKKSFEKLGLSGLPMAVALIPYMCVMLAAGIAFAHLIHKTLEVYPYQRVFGASIYGKSAGGFAAFMERLWPAAARHALGERPAKARVKNQ